MNRVMYGLSCVVGVLCVALSVAWIWCSLANGRLQTRLQQQQEGLNRGVLGAQGQEISANILRAMANVAGGDVAMQRLLEKHGYRLQAPMTNAVAPPPAALTNGPGVLVMPDTEDMP